MTLKAKLDLWSPNKHFYLIPWPQKPIKMVSFVILTFFIFPIWPLAAILNFSKRSIVRICHHVRNWSPDTILQESYVKLTISVPNGFKQKRPNFPMLIIFLIEVKMICICIILTIDIHENLQNTFLFRINFYTILGVYKPKNHFFHCVWL